MAFLPPSARARQLAAKARQDLELNTLYEKQQEATTPAVEPEVVVEPASAPEPAPVEEAPETLPVQETSAEAPAQEETVEVPPTEPEPVQEAAPTQQEPVVYTKTALNKLLKDQLLAIVAEKGIQLPPEANTKAEIIDVILAHQDA